MEKRKIEDLLDMLEIPVSNYGYQYLITGIELYRKDNKQKIMAIYEQIAKKHNTTSSRAERAIRQCWYKKEETIKKYFKINYNITNSRMLGLLTRELEREKC